MEIKMGMLGVYMALDDKSLNRLKKLKEDEIADEIENMEQHFDACDIGKSWDGLHFILTGYSAPNPIENNKLSEAITGIHNFSKNEDADFVAYTRNDELAAIITAMESVDENTLKERFDPKLLRKHDIYPNIWEDNKKECLCKELMNEFYGLLTFYKNTFKNGLHIVVSIY
jgi:hypothetical protein